MQAAVSRFMKTIKPGSMMSGPLHALVKAFFFACKILNQASSYMQTCWNENHMPFALILFEIC
jgi:hypothetical protein